MNAGNNANNQQQNVIANNNGVQEMNFEKVKEIFDIHQAAIKTLNDIVYYKDNIFQATLFGSFYSINHDTNFDLDKNFQNIIKKHPEIDRKCKQHLKKYPNKATFSELLSFVNDVISDPNIELSDILNVVKEMHQTVNEKKQSRDKISKGFSFTFLVLSAFTAIGVPCSSVAQTSSTSFPTILLYLA